MSAKWRLLELGETIQEGDQWHDHKTNLWAFAHQGVGDAVQTIDGPVRRRMTPPEEHAEELLALLKESLNFIEDLHPHFAGPNRPDSFHGRAEALLAKTGGRYS